MSKNPNPRTLKRPYLFNKNSKHQSTNLRNDNNTGRLRIVRRCDTKVVNVLVIEY